MYECIQAVKKIKISWVNKKENSEIKYVKKWKRKMERMKKIGKQKTVDEWLGVYSRSFRQKEKKKESRRKKRMKSFHGVNMEDVTGIREIWIFQNRPEPLSTLLIRKNKNKIK